VELRRQPFQNFLCPLTAVLLEDGSLFQYDDLVTSEPESRRPACKRVVLKGQNKVDLNCRLTLRTSQDRVITVSDSTPRLSFSSTQISDPNPFDSSSTLVGDNTNFFLASFRSSLPLSTGNLNLRQALRNLRNRNPGTADGRQPRSSQPAGQSRSSAYQTKPGDTNLIVAESEGECCWILFSSANYQGRRGTVCDGFRLVSLPAVLSLQRV